MYVPFINVFLCSVKLKYDIYNPWVGDKALDTANFIWIYPFYCCQYLFTHAKSVMLSFTIKANNNVQPCLRYVLCFWQ